MGDVLSLWQILIFYKHEVSQRNGDILGATTLSITTFSITTFSITRLSITRLSIKGSFTALSIGDSQHNGINSVIMLNVACFFIVLLSVILRSVVMLSVVMLSVAGYFLYRLFYIFIQVSSFKNLVC